MSRKQLGCPIDGCWGIIKVIVTGTKTYDVTYKGEITWWDIPMFYETCEEPKAICNVCGAQFPIVNGEVKDHTMYTGGQCNNDKVNGGIHEE